MKTIAVLLITYLLSTNAFPQEKTTTETQQDTIHKPTFEQLYDTAPEFPGGMQFFSKIFIQRFPKPKVDWDKKQVTVIVQFTVEKDGSLTNFFIAKDPGYDVGEEAIRTMQSMPKWKAATKDGKSVSSKFILPITIRLQ